MKFILSALLCILLSAGLAHGMSISGFGKLARNKKTTDLALLEAYDRLSSQIELMRRTFYALINAQLSKNSENEPEKLLWLKKKMILA